MIADLLVWVSASRSSASCLVATSSTTCAKSRTSIGLRHSTPTMTGSCFLCPMTENYQKVRRNGGRRRRSNRFE
jgi:hypothetical protein